MRLSLSSAAAPEARLGQLLEAAARRGFGAVELREGDGHGVAPDQWLGITAAAAEAAVAGIGISGYRVLQPARDLALARLSHALGAPILLDGPKNPAGRLDRAVRLRRAGADVAVVLRGTSSSEAGTIIAAAGLSLAWDADPRLGALDPMLEALLRDAPHALQHIRLLGGGPEVGLQEDSGVDRLMRRLALEGYEGTLVVAPSSTRHRIAWQHWLRRRGGGTGCGSGRAAR
jgi:sugar phosphate isomerase/epimerase